MEGTISEIRLFAGNFAPKNWAFCNGLVINIQQNTALFSLLGTTYGGNGTTTFGLPNLNGRVAVGAGAGAGLTPRVLAEQGGLTAVTLDTTQMPAHTHSLSVSPTLSVNDTDGTANVASSMAVLGNTVLEGGLTLQAFNTTTPDVAMHPESVGVLLDVNNGGVQGAGGSHNNLQPYNVLNYIICLYGIFPTRPQ